MSPRHGARPHQHRRVFWGWPNRFLRRMADSGSEVFVVGAYRRGSFTTGIDTPADLAQLPADYAGGASLQASSLPTI